MLMHYKVIYRDHHSGFNVVNAYTLKQIETKKLYS